MMPEGSSIVEIRAGADWQANMLAERGYFIEVIDIISRFRWLRLFRHKHKRFCEWTIKAM